MNKSEINTTNMWNNLKNKIFVKIRSRKLNLFSKTLKFLIFYLLNYIL